MLVAGIDFSSHAVDVVTIDLDFNHPPIWRRYELTGHDAFDRTRSVRAAMPTSSHWDDVLAIGIEHPAGRHGTGPLMRIQGAVLACLPPTVLVQPWPPAAWRKAVGLSGNASKGAVMHHVKETGVFPSPRLTWPQDACDAWCIAQATRTELNQQHAA